MKYTETTTIRRRQSLPIGEFLPTNELVRQQAEGEPTVDWLASQFLPDAEMAEGYQDWIARQVVQVDEVGIPGKGRKGLVGGVAKAGGTDREDLPIGLPRRGEELHKMPGVRPHGSDPVGGGQTGQVHQNAAGSHAYHNLSGENRRLSA